MFIIITKIKIKFWGKDLYLFLSKKNLENIKIINNYYLQCYLLIQFIYFNKHNLIIYNQLKFLVFDNEMGLHNLLLFIT